MSTNIKEIGTLEVPIVLADDLRTTVKVWVVKEKTAEDLEAESRAGETDVTSSGAIADVGPGALGE